MDSVVNNTKSLLESHIRRSQEEAFSNGGAPRLSVVLGSAGRCSDGRVGVLDTHPRGVFVGELGVWH